MMAMKRTPLGQLATVSAGQSAPKDNEFSEAGTPFVRAGSLDALLAGKSESELELVSDSTAKLRKLKLYPKGTIVFAKSGMSATKGRVYVLRSAAYVVSHLATLIPHDDVHVEYLRLALKAFPPTVLIRDPAYPSISLADIQSYELPVPNLLDDQVRIAQVLGKVEGLIAQRKLHLRQLEVLLTSAFLERFGDPVRNEKGWEKKPFSELLVEIESGKSPKCEARPAAAGEWGVLKLGAVTGCNYKESENKALPDNSPPSVRDEVRSGDLLFSRKNTYELVAACAYVFATRPKLLMPDLIFRFVFRDDAGVNPIYIWKLLTSKPQRKAIQSLATGAAGSMPNISKANLREVLLPIPPLPLQDEFAVLVANVEGLKDRYRQSLRELEALYGVLSQRAFQGALDLSQAALPDVTSHELQSSMPIESAQPATAPQTINLPDTELLLATLHDRGRIRDLLQFWLETYRLQLGGAPFSAQTFMALAQTRMTEQLQAVLDDENASKDLRKKLTELHPNNDFQLGIEDYEHVKAWVFDRIDAGQLKQTRDIFSADAKRQFGNQIVLRARLPR